MVAEITRYRRRAQEEEIKELRLKFESQQEQNDAKTIQLQLKLDEVARRCDGAERFGGVAVFGSPTSSSRGVHGACGHGGAKEALRHTAEMIRATSACGGEVPCDAFVPSGPNRTAATRASRGRRRVDVCVCRSAVRIADAGWNELRGPSV